MSTIDDAIARLAKAATAMTLADLGRVGLLPESRAGRLAIADQIHTEAVTTLHARHRRESATSLRS